jgi:hypothetical protein
MKAETGKDTAQARSASSNQVMQLQPGPTMKE